VIRRRQPASHGPQYVSAAGLLGTRPGIHQTGGTQAISDSVAAKLQSAFAEGTFTQVDVLGYGDAIGVEGRQAGARGTSLSRTRALGDRRGCGEWDRVGLDPFGGPLAG
jgi:hypothetical protein